MHSRLSISGFDPQGIFGIFMPRPVRDRVRQNDTRRFKNWRPMPFYQKGSLQMLYALFDDGGSGIVVLSAAGATQTTSGTICHSGPAFQTDGGLDEVGPTLGARTQLTAGEWWSAEPASGIGSSYDVRALSAGKTGTWSNSAAADDTWIQMSAERVWRVTVTAQSSPASKSASATFEIRDTGSGSALDSAVISANANN